MTLHYNDVIMSTMASQITSLTIVYSTVYSDGDQRKHQSSASLAFVRGIHQWPVNSPHKWPVTRKMSPFDDVIMSWSSDITSEILDSTGSDNAWRLLSAKPLPEPILAHLNWNRRNKRQWNSTFSYKKIHSKMSVRWLPFCVGLNGIMFNYSR